MELKPSVCVLAWRRCRDIEVVMILHRIRGWELPVGHIESGESTAAAAARECEEESGIKISEPMQTLLSKDKCIFVSVEADGEPTPRGSAGETEAAMWMPMNEVGRLVPSWQHDAVSAFRYSVGESVHGKVKTVKAFGAYLTEAVATPWASATAAGVYIYIAGFKTPARDLFGDGWLKRMGEA